MKFELLETLLKNRNYSDTEIDHIIYNKHLSIQDPLELPHAYDAAVLLRKYCEDWHSEIYIFADYDVDGLTSGYILKDILDKYSKGYVAITFPNRKDGYGINLGYCQKIINNVDTTKDKVLVVTVDNGITCLEEIKYLQDYGVEVLVLDHHEAKEQTPNCLIVDPHGPIQTQKYYHLCGCGVVFKVMQIFMSLYNDYNMIDYTPYLALGTLADIMELTEENIAFIRYGIDEMNKKTPNVCLGLRELLDYCGLIENIIYPEDLNFSIIPKLNACGRMNNIELAYELLTCENKIHCEDIINRMVKLNDKRKELSKTFDYISYADKVVNDTLFVILGEEYSGICGTIASSALENLNVSVAIVTSQIGNKLVGSIRTINSNFDAQAILQNELEKNNIEYFGGHKSAAGFSLLKDKAQDFCDSVTTYVGNLDIQDDENISSIDGYDVAIDLEDIDKDLYPSFAFVPFKNDPIFLISDVFCVTNKVSKNNPKNIEYGFTQNNKPIKYIWVWGQDNFDILQSRVNLYCNIIKDFRNPKKYTARILDIDK